MNSALRLVIILAWYSLPMPCAMGQADDPQASDPRVTYQDQVLPIFRQRCAACHNPNKRSGDLDLTNYTTLMQGGSSGAVIDPGDAGISYLFSLINHDDEPNMPPDSEKIPQAEIDTIRSWIDAGAPENRSSKVVARKKMTLAGSENPTERPEVIPLPARMVLEPFFPTPTTSAVQAIATSPWAPIVAVAGQQQVLLYHTQSLQLIGVLPFPEGQPNVVRFSRNGRLLLVAGGRSAVSGIAVVWDIVAGQRVTEVGNEIDTVLAADITADHSLIALGGPQKVVRVYSTESGQLVYEMTKHTDWVTAVEFSPDGVLLASGDRNGGLFLSEALSGREYLTLKGHTAGITSLTWRGDSNLLASGSEDSTVRLWEPENGGQVRNWSAHGGGVLAMDFTGDGRIATCGRDRLTRIWDQNGQVQRDFETLGDLAVQVSFCDETQRAIAGDYHGNVYVWNAADGNRLGMLDSNPPPLDQRLAAAQQHYGEKLATHQQAAELLNQAQAAAQTAQDALSQAQSAQQQAQSQVAQLESEVNQANVVVGEADKQKMLLQTELTQSQQAQPLLNEALRNMIEAAKLLPGDAALSQSANQLTEQVKQMETRIAQLQTDISTLASTVNQTTAKIEQTTSSMDEAQQALAQAQQQVAQLQAQLDPVVQQLQAAQQTEQAAKSDLDQAAQQVERWNGEIGFKQLLEQLAAQLQAAQQQAEEKQSELQAAQGRLAEVQATVDQASSNASTAESEVQRIEDQIRKARGGG